MHAFLVQDGSVMMDVQNFVVAHGTLSQDGSEIVDV